MAIYLQQKKQGGGLQDLLSIFGSGSGGGSNSFIDSILNSGSGSGLTSGGEDTQLSLNDLMSLFNAYKSGGSGGPMSWLGVGQDLFGMNSGKKDTGMSEAIKYGSAGSVFGPWGTGIGAIYGFGKGADLW